VQQIKVHELIFVSKDSNESLASSLSKIRRFLYPFTEYKSLLITCVFYKMRDSIIGVSKNSVRRTFYVVGPWYWTTGIMAADFPGRTLLPSLRGRGEMGQRGPHCSPKQLMDFQHSLLFVILHKNR